MFDLKERGPDELNSVPVPLPGRVMLFAGPGGVMMVRLPGGQIRGFTKKQKMAPAAIHQGAGVQVLAGVTFAAGTLADGDVVELLAPMLLSDGAAKMNVLARADSGAWVPVFSALRAAKNASVSLWAVVQGGVLWVQAWCCTSSLRVGTTAALVTPEAQGIVVGSSAALPFIESGANALEVAIEWTLPPVEPVVTLPYTVQVS